MALGLLESVEQDGATPQRRLATDRYRRRSSQRYRCVEKGFVKVTQAHARRYGYYLIPQGLVKRHHARRVETVKAPLFPGYLFAAINRQTQRWRCISSAIRVSHLICNGEEPVAVADSVVDALRDREDESGLVCLRPHASFATGDKVRLLDGAFAGLIELFEGMNSERVSVLLDLLGRKVRLLLDAHAIDAV